MTSNEDIIKRISNVESTLVTLMSETKVNNRIIVVAICILAMGKELAPVLIELIK